MLVAILFIASVLISLGITFLVRFYAVKHLLDIPNHRSSHRQPTPRGGGLGIVVAFISSIWVYYYNGLLEIKVLYAFAVSLIIAGIGFWDDHQHIAARWRLAVHLGAALIAIYLLMGANLQDHQLVSSLLGYLCTAVLLVWALNLFNFMDGIDGIAASEAIFVSAALAGLMWFVNVEMAWLGGFLSAASLGFLFLNWPLAKIFMGDVGSGFLGFVLGLLILLYSQVAPIFMFIGLILFAVFITDATYTLLARVLTGEKWYQAHCTHAYQHAAKRYGHLRVVLVMWSINLFWILPVVVLVFIKPEYVFPGVIAVYGPLIFLAYKFNAGSNA